MPVTKYSISGIKGAYTAPFFAKLFSCNELKHLPLEGKVGGFCRPDEVEK